MYIYTASKRRSVKRDKKKKIVGKTEGLYRTRASRENIEQLKSSKWACALSTAELTLASSLLRTGELVPSEKNPSRQRLPRNLCGITRGNTAQEQRKASNKSSPSSNSFTRIEFHPRREVITTINLARGNFFSGTLCTGRHSSMDSLRKVPMKNIPYTKPKDLAACARGMKLVFACSTI